MSDPTASVEFKDRPIAQYFVSYIEANARLGLPAVTKNSRVGKTVLICGAGPTLDTPEAKRELEMAHGEVWACNAALVWLTEHGYRVTHGVTIDSLMRLGSGGWPQIAPPVDYLVASTCHPDLVDGLLKQGRKVTFLHTYMGCPGEVQAYRKLWPSGFIAGAGMNVAPRACEIARWMGFKKITLIGVGTGPDDGPLHVGGLDPQPGKCMLVGDFAGRHWTIAPEFLFQARLFTDMSYEWGSRLKVVDPLVEELRKLPIPQLNTVVRGVLKGADRPDHPSITLKANTVESDVFAIQLNQVAACSVS